MVIYLTRREGSGVRSDGSKPLTLSPLKEGISCPLTVSVGLDLGLDGRSGRPHGPEFEAEDLTWRIVRPYVQSEQQACLPLVTDA